MPNVCLWDGFVVAGTREVPEAAYDYCWQGRFPFVGCNHIRCNSCGSDVKQRPGFFRISSDDPPRDAWEAGVRAVLERGDWSAVPSQHPDPGSRLYLCKCNWHNETFEQGLGVPPPEDRTSNGVPPTSWRCAGHPEVTLPFSLDGERFNTEQEVVEAALRGFGGFRPRTLDRDAYGTWTSRLHGIATGTALATRIERLTVDSLHSADAATRRGAVKFLRSHRNLEGDRVAIDWALAGGDATPFVQRELIDTVASLYNAKVIDDSRLAEFVRARAQQPDVRPAVLDTLVERDPKWFLGAAESIVRANPQAVILVLERFDTASPWSDRAAFLAFAAKLAQIPGVNLDALRRQASSYRFAGAKDELVRIVDEANAANAAPKVPCDEGGMMVGSNDRLPGDGRERYRSGGEILGCNRIRCARCNTWVRNVPGVKQAAGTLSEQDHWSLHLAFSNEDATHEHVTRNLGGDPFRVYACACGWDQTSGVKWLSSSERDGWACTGHDAS